MTSGDGPWDVAATEVGRGLLGQQLYAEAEPFLVDSYPILVEQSGWAGGGAAAWQAVIALYVAWDKPQLARPYVQSRLDAARRVAEAPDANANNQNYVAYLVLTAPLPDMRDAEVAMPFAKRAVQMSEGGNAHYLHNLARCHFLLGDVAKALDLQRQAVSLLSPADGPNPNIIRQRLAEYEAAAEP